MHSSLTILDASLSGAIVAKIWRARRQVASASRTLFPVIAVIVESGAIYTTSVLGLLVAYLSNSNGQYTALDLVTPLVVSITRLTGLADHANVS